MAKILSKDLMLVWIQKTDEKVQSLHSTHIGSELLMKQSCIKSSDVTSCIIRVGFVHLRIYYT